ncbi:MAG TPA: protein translocase subunit SecD [Acidimicrobiales bacterium]|nr:protein translocase subunit SecD [Acidimicrobiales bacterium]
MTSIVLLAAISFGLTIGFGHTPLLGLDLKGGLSVVETPTKPATSAQLKEAVSIIDRRVNGLGVSNASVAVQGSDVVIDLPGIKDAQQALKALGTTAELYFRPVYCTIPAYAAPTSSTTTTTTTPKSPATTLPARSATTSTTVKSVGAAATPNARLTSALRPAAASASTTPTTVARPSPTTTPTTTAPATPGALTTSEAQALCTSTAAAGVPSTPAGKDDPTVPVILPVDPKAYPQSPTIRYVLGPADLTGTAVSDAAAQINTTTGQYSVQLTLTSKGATQFDSIATARYACYQQSPANPPPCSQEAFELDGTVESAPNFQASSFNGNVSITGSFTSSQASNLANELKYGALPVTFQNPPKDIQVISATVGKDSLRAGLFAGIGGLIVVMLYMIIYYRALGLVVLIGLGVGGSLLYSIITQLSYSNGLTLTLEGVTGIIVSIGITVDSYVVYFERLKDEVRAGRSVRQSVERAFSRAWRTVLTADLVSFMAALILYLLSIGDVRGFAFTLGLSTLLDVATAYFFIRPAVILVGRRRTFTENRFLGISRGLGARVTEA